MTQVNIPTEQFKPFTEKYPSLDTSSATESSGLTTFSVPSSALLEGSAPQSPTLRTINQNRFGGVAPVQVPPVAGPMPPPPAPSSGSPAPAFSGGGAPIPDSGPGYTPPAPPTPSTSAPSGVPAPQLAPNPARATSTQPNHESPTSVRETPPKTDRDSGESERKT